MWELGAGVLAATFVCPLDVIKTRFQVHGLPKLGGGNIKGASFLAFGCTSWSYRILTDLVALCLGSLACFVLQNTFEVDLICFTSTER